MILDADNSLEALGLQFCAKGWFEQSVLTQGYEVPDDTALAIPPMLFDMRRMQRLLQLQLSTFNPQLQLHSTKIAYLRYKPARYLQIAYCLNCGSVRRGGRYHHLLIGKYEQSTKDTAATDTRLKLSADVLDCKQENGQLTLDAFPHDSRMPTLPLLLQQQRFADYINATVGLASLAPMPTPAFANLESRPNKWADVLSYRPGRYCLIRYSTAQEAQTKVVARMVRDRAIANSIWHATQHLWRESRTAKPTVVHPLYYDEQLAIIWQRAMPGDSLTNVILAGTRPKCVAEAAQTLANMHRMQLHQLHYRGPSATHDSLRADLATLAHRQNYIGDSAREAQQLLKKMQPAERTPGSLIHGDFSANQAVCNEMGTQLLDLSGVGGDAEQDLANFAARLQHHLASSAFEAVLSHFYSQYSLHVDTTPSPARTNWYRTVSDIRNGLTWIKRCRAGASAVTSQQLQQALSRLKEST